MKTRIPQQPRHTLSARILKKTRGSIEPLESRIAPASLVSLTGGDLSVFDSVNGNDTITISVNAGNYHFNDPSGIGSGSGSFQIDGNNVEVPIAAVTGNFSVLTNGGNDTVTFSTALSTAGDLLVNTGLGADAIVVDGVLTPGGHASLTSGGGIVFNNIVTMAVNKNLSVKSDGLSAGINLASTASHLSASGTGAISLTAARDIVLTGGAGATGTGVTTEDGNLTLSANAAGTTTGNFIGVDVNNGVVGASGAGSVSVIGHGGDGSGAGQHGVLVHTGGHIHGGATGLLFVNGTSGASVASFSTGVTVSDAGSSIDSGGADVQITGKSLGTGTSAQGYGVNVQGGALVGVGVGGGSSTVTVVGTGGGGSGGNQHGVVVQQTGSIITSNGGNVQITGTEGTGASSVGIFNLSSGAISTAVNGGTITLLANSMDIAAGISAQGTSSVTLLPRTNGVAINLGSAANPVGGPLSLTDAELDLITAGTVQIGNASSGAITVSAALTHNNHLSLTTGAGVSGAVGIALAAGRNLGISANGGINLSGAISVPGTTTLAAGSANNISLTNAGNALATVNVMSGATVSLLDNGGFNLGAINVSTLLSVTSAGPIIQSLPITGTGGLTKLGTGTLTLSSPNTYGGTTTINGGKIQVGTGGGSGSLGSGAVVDNATLSFNRSDIFTVPNGISGTGGLTKLGTGTLALNGVNTYSGTTTISGGTLQVGAGGTSGTLGSGAVVDNATLAIFRSDTLTLANAISGTGSLAKLGTGTFGDVLILTGTNTYAGTTTINAGTLQVGTGGTSGTLGSGAVTNNAALVFNLSSSLTLANAISGTGTLDVTAGGITTSGVLNLGGDATFNSTAGITFTNSVTMAAGKSLTANAVSTIALVNGSNLSANGTGAISLTTARDIVLASGTSGAVVLAQNGNLTLSANAAGTTTGNFIGVDVDGVTVQATGTGVVSVTGKGGDMGMRNVGVRLQNGGDIIGGTTGTMTVNGTGGPGSVIANEGVRLDGDGVSITSRGANVSVTGVGNASGTAGFNFGVNVYSGALLSAGGSGNVTVMGTGAANLGSDNYGVNLQSSGSQITSSGGNVSVTGVSGGTGSGQVSVGLSIDSGVLSAGGSGTVTVIGTGDLTAAAVNVNLGIDVRFTSTITSSGGNVQVTGTAGAATSSNLGEGAGIRVFGDSLITAGGSGTVTVSGTGGAGTTASAHGVFLSGQGFNSNLAGIGAANGATTITATAGNTSSFALMVGTSNKGRIATGSNNPITITADSINIGGAATISSGTAATTITTRTAGTLINLGGADVLSGSPLTLGLTDTELDLITAGTVQIGDGSNGTTTISAVISHTGDLSLTANLINFTAGGGFSFALSGTGAAPVFGRVLIEGDINFTSGTLSLTGSLSSVPTAPVTLILFSPRADAVTPTGIFTGLPEGANITFGGANYPVSYLPGVSGRSIVQLLTPTDQTNDKVITITDVDRDIIRITTSNGKITPDMFTFGPNGIAIVDLHVGHVFLDGASITFAVTQVLGGDGIINIGAIDASGMTLGAVKVTGNLGKIDIGTNNPSVPALRSLTVASLGTLDGLPPLLTDAAAIAAVTSNIVGSVTRLNVTGDVNYANINVTNKIRYFTVGGDFKGTGSLDMEEQHALAALGFGVILPLDGGITLTNSGLKAGSLGIVNLKGSITNAAIKAAGNITAVKVAGNVNKSAIISGGSVKNINIGGDVISDDPNLPSVISAFVNTRTAASRAVSTLTVNGSVTNTEILIGYDEHFVGINSDVSIGTVTVKGTWTASSLSVGITDFTHDGFGRNDKPIFASIDGLGTDVTPAIISRIGTLTIAHLAQGTDSGINPNDHFGIIAESIGAATINGVKYKLTAAKDNFLIGPTGDFRLIEI